MAYHLQDKLVIGVSSRTLFDMSVENEIFETKGLEAYRAYQVAHEKEILKPGPGFELIRSLLCLNELPGHKDRVEVIIMSRNSADTALRVFASVAHYGLGITRAVLTSGAPLSPYLGAFETDLFLSAWEEDVQRAVDAGFAAGIICEDGRSGYRCEPGRKPGAVRPAVGCREACGLTKGALQIRIAFDADAVLFTEASERLFQKEGLAAFEENEKKRAKEPLPAGPFAGFLKAISALQKEFPPDRVPIRTALVTSRSAPAHERVIRTLRAWDVRIDEAFFLGGISKKEVLRAFGAQLFFDDQAVHTDAAAQVVPAARVPWPHAPEYHENVPHLYEEEPVTFPADKRKAKDHEICTDRQRQVFIPA